MVVEFGLAGCHVPKDIMHDGNALKTIVVEERALILQVFELLECVFDLALLHQCQSEVIFSLEVFLNKLFF